MFIEKQKKVLVVTVALLVVLFFGSSYALLTNFDDSGEVVNVTMANLDMSLTSPTISLGSKIPISDAVGMSLSTTPSEIILTNSGTMTIGEYDVRLIYDTSNPKNVSNLDYQYIKFSISTESNINTFSEPKTLSEVDNIIYRGYDLLKGKSQTLYIKLWIDENAGNNAIGKSFYGTVDIMLYQRMEETDNKIIEYLKNQNTEIRNDTTGVATPINFSEISSPNNGEGLYLRNGTGLANEKPIYYFRGSQSLNNNVYFAGYCWKIVRTTETGGTKLIYNGEPTEVDNKPQCTNTTGNSTMLASTSTFNSSSDSPTYVGYNQNEIVYTYTETISEDNVKFGTGIDPITKKLLNQTTTLDETHHYTYNSTSTDATEVTSGTGMVRYYYFDQNYLEFENTKTIEEVLDDMLTADTNLKTRPATIHTALDTFYATYLKDDYYNYFEDTIWCNDKNIASFGGFNSNGGVVTGTWNQHSLVFTDEVKYESEFQNDTINISQTNTPKFTCSRNIDKYTVSSDKLDYPIGLLTKDEIALAGITSSSSNTSNYLYTSQSYWTLSPASFSNGAMVGIVDSTGILSSDSVSKAYGVRPSISLKSTTDVLSGTGTATDPLIITE